MYRITYCLTLLIFAPMVALAQATPGFWTGDYSIPRGCAWNVHTLATVETGEVYLSLQGHTCGQASGTLFVYDPAVNDFEAVGEFSHDSNPSISVLSMRADGSDIYIGGSFTHIDGIEVNGIARLDTTTGQWSALGSGESKGITDGFWVNDLLLTDDDIFVTGMFFEMGGVASTRGIARWDRAQEQWHAMGGGITDENFGGGVWGRSLAMDDTGTLYLGGMFEEVGNEPADNIAAWNGVDWGAVGGGINGTVEALATDGSDLYVGGEFTEAGGEAVGPLVKWDGSEWQEPASEIDGVSFFSAKVATLIVADGFLYVGGFFNSIDGVAARSIARMELATGTWSALGAAEGGGLGRTFLPMLFSRGVEAIAVDGDQLYAGGDIIRADTHAVNNVARFDLSTDEWLAMGQNIGAGISGQDTWSVDFTAQGPVMVGPFGQSGLLPSFGVTRPDLTGGEWSGLADNDEQYLFSSKQRVLGLDDEIFLGGTMYVRLNNPDDPTIEGSVDRIMRWDEGSDDWVPLEDVNTAVSGISGNFSSMAGHADMLYVGGTFEEAGGHAANNIARWDIASNTWSALGDGLDDRAAALLATSDGLLYAAGPFTTAGGAPASGIAVWNANTESWSPLGEGIANANDDPVGVAAMGQTNDGDLLVGGSFDTAGGATVNRLARWDGSQWHDFGSGLSHVLLDEIIISAIVADETGDVFVGGNFTHADGLRVNNLARWDGSQWHKVGGDESTSGVDSPGNARVIGLALDGPDLLVAGHFSKAGGEVASHFGHFVRDLDGAQLEINTNVEEVDNTPAGQSQSLLVRSSSSSLLYTIDVLNVGMNRAYDVEFSISADPVPDTVEWTCQPIPDTNAVCPAASGSGLPNLVFDLPHQSGLRFEILASIDSDELYEQELSATASAEPVFPGDNTESQSSSTTYVNDVLFQDQFE